MSTWYDMKYEILKREKKKRISKFFDKTRVKLG